FASLCSYRPLACALTIRFPIAVSPITFRRKLAVFCHCSCSASKRACESSRYALGRQPTLYRRTLPASPGSKAKGNLSPNRLRKVSASSGLLWVTTQTDRRELATLSHSRSLSTTQGAHGPTKT